MDDGNKESTKEMLTTFRTLFAINVSGVVLLVNLNAKNEILYHSETLFWLGIILAGISICAMIYLFFLTIPKLYQKENNIIYSIDILISSIIAFFTFILSYLVTIVNVIIS